VCANQRRLGRLLFLRGGDQGLNTGKAVVDKGRLVVAFTVEACDYRLQFAQALFERGVRGAQILIFECQAFDMLDRLRNLLLKTMEVVGSRHGHLTFADVYLKARFQSGDNS